MKKTKIYDVTTRILMGLLVLFLFAVLLRYGTRKIIVEELGLQGRVVSAVMFDAPELAELPEEPIVSPPPEEDGEEQPVQPDTAQPVRDKDGIIWSTKVDWKALYPPREEEPDPVHSGLAWKFAEMTERLRSSTGRLEERVAAFEQELNSYTEEYVVFYSKMVELANLYDRFLGWEIAGTNTYNPVIELEDNYFITCTELTDMTERAQEIIALRNFLAEQGVEHLYVETGSKVCREDDQVSGIVNFSNQNADLLLGMLEKKQVNTLDLRGKLHAAGMDHHDSFFETDHHWKPETGLWAAGELAKKLNEEYGFSIDLSLFDLENFEQDVYEDYFLGSQGKKVTLSRATPEDISLLYPKFAVDLSIEIPSLSVEKTGDFSIMYRYDPVNSCDYYGLNPYGAYFYGDNALTRIVNHQVTDGKRILVLGHSFDNTVLPFLALGVSSVDSIDLRSFDGSLETYLLENHYDVVIEFYTT